MKKYRAAIVGCGRIASLFAQDKKRSKISVHAQAYLQNPKTELVAACDLDKNRLAEFGHQWGIQALYTNFDEMIRRESIDLLSVCTWNSGHAELIEKAARGRVKGIICEKPLADSLKNAQRIIRASTENKIPVLVNYSRRYLLPYQKLKNAVDRADLGDIQAVSCYYTAGLMNTGTHLFDLLIYLFGDVRWAWADPDTSLPGQDKSLSGYISFKKGFGASVAALDVQKYLIFEIHIYGSKKTIKITDSGFQFEIFGAAPSPRFSGYRALQMRQILKVDFGMALPNLISNLVDVVEKRKKPLCSAVDGKKSMEIAAAFVESYEKRGQRIVWPISFDKIMSSR